MSRGGVAFWVGSVRNHGGQLPIQRRSWSLSQALDVPWTFPQTRPLSGAAWALAPPNSLRYQTVRQPVLSHPLHHASLPQRLNSPEDEWQECVSVCVLLRAGECDGLHTLLRVPLFAEDKPGAPLCPDTPRSSDLSFPLTTVDGCRKDDISVDNPKSWRSATAATASFRSLFEAEGCPAPYMSGSTFYCFHCPAAHLVPDCTLESSQLRLSTTSPQSRGRTEGDGEREEKLDLMFERLRLELPGFFTSNHDYSMYSHDVEFINGLVNVRTRGILLYQLTLSLWRLLCLCYYVEGRLDVLKLTKHSEDGTVRARWRIKGLPIHSVMLRFYRKDKSQLYRSYDAFSTFYMGQDGLIHCHRVEKVMPAQPPVLPRVTSLLAGALVALGLQEHRPALNLLPLLLSSLRQNRN